MKTRVEKAVERRKLQNFEQGRQGSLRDRVFLVEMECRIVNNNAVKAAKPKRGNRTWKLEKRS